MKRLYSGDNPDALRPKADASSTAALAAGSSHAHA